MQVPTYDGATVGDTGLPDARVDSIASPSLLGVGAQQEQAFGGAVTDAGTAGVQIDTASQDFANQIRVNAAQNAAKEAQQQLTFGTGQAGDTSGFTQQLGIAALQRPSGMPLTDEYAGKFQDSLNDIESGLGNDAQKIAFHEQANNMLSQFQGQVSQHEADQFHSYALSTQDGTIKNALNDIELHYNDPTIIDQNAASIKAAVYTQGQLLGKSAEWIEAQTRDTLSSAHAVALDTALQKNDVMYAANYLAKYAGQMTGNDILKVQGQITTQVNSLIAQKVATNAVNTAQPRMMTSEVDRAFNILTGTESNNTQTNPDGTPVTSVKGALGVAQVMPATGPEAAAAAGLPWDPDRLANDAQYNAALGKAYFTKQLQAFGGNLGQAYAAYNAGPGATQAAVKQATADGDASKWLTYLPAETQGYVQKNMTAYGAGQGNYQKPTQLDIDNSIRNDPAVNTNPARLKLALEAGRSMYSDLSTSITQQGQQATADVMRQLEQNGGDYNALPPSAKSAIPVDQVDNVLKYAKNIAQGTNETDPALYLKLSTDRNFLQGMSDDQMYALKTQLSQKDFDHFSNERATLIDGKIQHGPTVVSNGAVTNALNTQLQTMGINPTPKEGTSDAMRLGAIRQYVDDSVLQAQVAQGKQMTDGDVNTHIAGLFSKNVGFRNTFLGFDTGGSTSMPLMSMGIGDIPGPTKASIKADFQSQGVSNPTDGQVLGAYFHLRGGVAPRAGMPTQSQPGQSANATAAGTNYWD